LDRETQRRAKARAGPHDGAVAEPPGTMPRGGWLACGLLFLTGFVGALPLAGQVTPPTTASPGDWTWVSGTNSLGSGQGQPGNYGTRGTPDGKANFPGGRWGAPSWIDNSGNLWLFGGFGFAQNGTFGYLNDLWVFDSSTNYWTWMGGSATLGPNYCGESPTFGTLGSFASGNIPGGRQSAATWTDKNGNLWLFGGQGDGFGAPGSGGACGGAYTFGYLSDLWEFYPTIPNPATGTKGEWAWIGGINTPNANGSYPAMLNSFAPGNVPGAREYAATWTDSSGNLWLFGGEGYDASGDFGELNDLWEFDTTLNQWAWMGGSSTVPPNSGNPGVFVMPDQYPGSRYGAASWADSSGNFWLFGGSGFDGAGNSGNLNDLWEFNPSTSKWAWISGSAVISNGGQPGMYGTLGMPSGTANFPGGRYEASSWMDSSGNLWLFGGEGVGATSTGMLNDLWAFNPPTDQWVWMGGSGSPFMSGVYGTLQSPASTNIPGGRNQAASWTDIDGNFWLFGGDGKDNGGHLGALNDLWVYPPPMICWGPPSALQISPSTLPVGFVGESYIENFAATGGCGSGYTWSVTSGTALSAVGLSLTPTGVISGSPNATETAAQFTVKVVDPHGNTGSQSYSLTIYPDISATPETLPAGTVGTVYSETFLGSGGSGGPYSFSVASGTALSAVGLTLSPAGVISGTPTGPETGASFTVQVADSMGNFTRLNYTLTVNSVVGQPAQVTDNETIIVSDSETFPDVVDTEKITVTDSEIVRAYNPLTIAPTPGSFDASSSNGYATYSYAPVQFASSGGIGTITLTETGTLPTGVTFVNGILSGTPAANSVGSYPFSVTAMDADGDAATVQGYLLTIQAASAFPAVVMDNEIIKVTDTVTFPDVIDSESITVTDTVAIKTGPIITTTGTLGAGEVNVPYTSPAFTASGGTGTYTWTAAGLPTGLTISSSAGALTGTPTVAGVFAITVTVTDSAGLSNFVVFSLTVTAPSLAISANPNALTIAQGESGETTLLFAPTGGYSGTLTLSCSGLPANSQCVFTLNGTAISQVTLTGNNQPVSVVLTIDTDVKGTQARIDPSETPLRSGRILAAMAFLWPETLVGIVALRRRRKIFSENQRRLGLCLCALVIGTLAGMAGCISGCGSVGPRTPIGNSTVTITVTPDSGIAQTLSIGVGITK
jgi:N-acetylneuraminic acid mutarotase